MLNRRWSNRSRSNRTVSIRVRSVLVAFASLAMTTAVKAQVVEEDTTEVLKPLEQDYKPVRAPNVADAATRIVEATNAFRTENKLKAVTVSPELRKATQYFADYMARTSRYGHKADGKTPADRARQFGYDHCIVAENIAYDFNSEGFSTAELARGFVEGWKHSPGHRRNMLDADVVETGVAVAQGRDNGYFFAVQMFARPKSLAVEFKITNESEVQAEYKMGDKTFVLPPRYTRSHEVCRVNDLAFRWPDAEGQEQTVRPANGDHFVIVQGGDELKLRKVTKPSQ